MYLVIEIQKMNNGQISHLVTTHKERSEADQKYHAVLSAAAVSNVDVHSAVMLDDTGERIKGESYYHGHAEAEE